MRILIVTQYFWPENFRINDLVDGLLDRGHQVVILTGKPNYPDGKVFADFVNNPAKFNRYKAAKVIRIPMIARGGSKLSLLMNYFSFTLNASLLGPWKLRGHKFDIVFAYQASPITVGIPAIILSSIKRAPLALWILDLWPDTLEALGYVRSKMLLRLMGKLSSIIYSRCDLILSQSKGFISKIRQYAGDGPSIKYFPGWAEVIFKTFDVTPAKEIHEKQGTFNVMFAGNIGKAQDFPAILDAAELLKDSPNIRWLIVGSGRKKNWVAKQINRRGLQSNVLLLGQFPLKRMPSFFLQADALLVSLCNQPLFSMTIPGKIQSYLTTGKPILAMLNGEGADLIHKGRAGLVCSSGDYKSLAKNVLKLSQMPLKNRQLMGARGIKLFNAEFNRDYLIPWLEILLKSLKS